MIFLSSLQSPVPTTSLPPDPNTSQIIASQSSSSLPKMPDQSTNIMDYQHDDDDGAFLPISQSRSQSRRRGGSPSLSPFPQSQNIQSILHKVSNTLLSLDSDNRSHRRKMDKALENMSNDISERMNGINESIEKSMKDGERWKDEILVKINQVDEKNKDRIEATEKNNHNLDILDKIRSLEKRDVEGKVDEVTKRVDKNSKELMDKFKHIQDGHMKDTEKIEKLEKKIEGLESILEQILKSQAEFGELQRAYGRQGSTLIVPTAPPTSSTNLNDGQQVEPESRSRNSQESMMPHPMIGGQDQDQDLQVEDDEMADMTLDMGNASMETNNQLNFTDLSFDHSHSQENESIDRLAPFQYGINPKDVMLPPPLESDTERGSTSARTISNAKVEESNSSSRSWWDIGGVKRKHLDQEDHEETQVGDNGRENQQDVIDSNRNEEQRNESASEERLDTPQTQTEEHFHTASPDIFTMPDLAGGDELDPDDDNDNDSQLTRPPARLPFPPRSSQKTSSPIVKKKVGPGRPRKSAPALLNSTSTSSTSTEPVNDSLETVSIPPNSQKSTFTINRTRAKTETPSRASKRPRIRPSYFEEVQEIPKPTASKSKSGKGRQRNFYGKIMLSTKGLLMGDGIKKTEAKWPTKGPYTVKSKLEEIVCDACRGRSHWACAGLDFDVDMSDKTWLCPDCEHIIEVEGKPRASIDTVQPVRCIRYNCVLRDKKAIEVREGEEDIFVIERLVGQRAIARVPDSQARIFEYLVKWEGWGWQDCTWEPVSNLAPRHENLISTFREVAQQSEVNLKAKVGILPEARGCWDPITGNNLRPDTPADGSDRARSASASASGSRSGTTLTRVNKRKSRDGTVVPTHSQSKEVVKVDDKTKEKMIQEGEANTNDIQEKGKEIDNGDNNGSGSGSGS